MSFETKTFKKIFLHIFVLALQTIDAQMLFCSIFFLMHLKKVNNRQKRPKWRFLRLIAFFSAFSKMLTKRTFVRLLFLKLNQS